MDCNKARKLLSPYADHELPDADKVLLESHVRDCAQCSARLEEIQRLHHAFEDLRVIAAPRGFATRTMARIAEGRPRRVSLFPVLTRIIEAAALIAIIMLGVESGTLIGKTFTGQKAGIGTELSLDTFESVQPGSIGGAYIAMMGEDYAK